ncbi:AAA family ATPase [Pseudorhodoferax sp.]|uniref:AAA family ATPase n=1 Tax=Pseudorhodoferax sp. TaxID=1993553 RepID=UPI0039E51293
MDEDELLDLLQAKRKDLIDAALNGSPPVQVIRQAIEATRNAIEPFDERSLASLLVDVDAAIVHLLSKEGIEPYSQTFLAVGDEKIPVSLFYRPAEQLLFAAIDEQPPVLLATTPEPQRFIRALMVRCATQGYARPLQMWSPASGLFEIKGVGSEATFHDVANPERRFGQEVKIGVMSDKIDGDMDPEARNTLVRLLLNADDFKLGKVDLDGMSFGVAIKAQESGVEIVVDDLSDGPTPGLELTEALREQLRRWALELAAAAQHAHQVKENQFLQEIPFGKVIAYLIEKSAPGSLVVLLDCHHHLAAESLQSGLNTRVVKDAYYRLKRERKNITLLMFASETTLPADLREELRRINLSLPSRHELLVALRKRIALRELPSAFLEEGPEGHLIRLVEAAAGMTLGEACSVIDRFARRPRLPAELVEAMHDAKNGAVNRSQALEVVETRGQASAQLGEADQQLGGMERLVAWLKSRRKVFDHPEAARAAGIDRRPKGVLLLGIPGAGKSLAAKVVACTWRLPLLRFDMGAVRDKYVGSSEARMREALRTVTAMAPCVLWIDEIDKGVAQGDNTHSSTADLNLRASLLTWMQEYREPVFIVATANRISSLPPELMRAGRFDARFFLGCPGPSGRREILSIHLTKRMVELSDDDIDAIANASHGFTGAELEQLVLDVLYDCFNEINEIGTVRPTRQHFLTRLENMQPVIKTVGIKGADGHSHGGLDEVWDLIEEGRVELASEFLLTRSQVSKLIDPYLYRPVYCHKEKIEGFEKLHTRAERLVMGSPFHAPVATVLGTGDSDWIYVETNVKFEPSDLGCFKFIDQWPTVEDNGVFDMLITQYGIEQIIFTDPDLLKAFQRRDGLAQYSELLVLQ